MEQIFWIEILFFFCEQKKEQLSTQKKSIKINSIEKEFI